MAEDKSISLHGLDVFLQKLKQLFSTKDEAIMYDTNFVYGDTLFVDGTVDGDTLEISKGKVVGDTLYLD